MFCSWKPPAHTEVNQILDHHVKVRVKSQKRIMRKKIQGGDITKEFLAFDSFFRDSGKML